MGISKYIAAAALSASNIWVQAWDTFERQVIERIDPKITDICSEYSMRSNEILKWDQICEYSTDSWTHWQEIIGGLGAISAIIWIGWIFRFRKMRKWKSRDPEESAFLSNDRFPTTLNDNAAIDITTPNTNWETTINPLIEAKLAIIDQDYTKAEEYLLAGIKEDPQDPELYIKLLQVHKLTNNIQKFRVIFIMLKGSQFNWVLSEKEIDQIVKWGKEIDASDSLYQNMKNHKNRPTIETLSTIWVLVNNWNELPILTEQVQKIGKTNEPIKITEEEKLKIIERLRWIPMNPKMIDPGEFKKFEIKRINEAVMNQLIQRWFSIIEDEESWVVLVRPIKQWSSLYYLDKWNIGIISTNESYIINPQTRNATMDYLDGIPCIKLTLPRGEVEYIQINGTRIPIIHKK